MKNLLFLLLLVFAIAPSCESEDVYQEEEDEEVTGGIGANYIAINGETFDMSISESKTITPQTLNADSYNTLDVNINVNYTVYINGMPYENGTDHKLYVGQLDPDNVLNCSIVNNTTDTFVASYINTYPDDFELGPVCNYGAEPGFYYSAFDDYIFKLNTNGELIYYKYVLGGSYFNRAEIDGEVYYSYLESMTNSSTPKLDGISYSHKQAVIMDQNYQEVDRLKSVISNGVIAYGTPLDNHQFEVLGENHYLITAFIGETVTNIPDEVAHNSEGTNVVAAVIQEIKDGELVFQWKSTDFTDLYALSTSSDFTSGEYVDYMHVNSVEIDPSDNNLLISFKALSSIFKVDRQSGDIIWIFGGEGDMFNLSDEQKFLGQHDIRVTGPSEFTIFNNNYYGSTSGAASGVMKFTLNEENLSVEQFESYYKSGVVVYSEGSAQELGTGHYLVGWGRTTKETFLFSEENLITGEVYFSVGLESSFSVYNVFKYDR